MKRSNRQVRGLVSALVCIGLVGAIVVKIPPDKWWIETLAIALVWATLFLGVAWVWRSKLWGIKISGWILLLLILRRFGVLDPITFGIWLFLLGLICLFN